MGERRPWHRKDPHDLRGHGGATGTGAPHARGSTKQPGGVLRVQVRRSLHRGTTVCGNRERESKELQSQPIPTPGQV